MGHEKRSEKSAEPLFRVRVSRPEIRPLNGDTSSAGEPDVVADERLADDEQWPSEEIEEAYQKALEAIESLTPSGEFDADDLAEARELSGTSHADESALDDPAISPLPIGNANGDVSRAAAVADVEPSIAKEIPAPHFAPSRINLATDSGWELSSSATTSSSSSTIEATDEAASHETEAGDGPRSTTEAAFPTLKPVATPAVEEPSLSASAIIEAALFLAVSPLTARKLSQLLGGNIEPAAVESFIDELNTMYADEARPYEIRLGDGGYRLELRPEYEPVRHAVYGVGPREVRLAQETLEVLALVAYQQPVARARLEELLRRNAGAALRQLLRLDLVSLERDPENRDDVRYRSTDRFLSLFGLGSLQDLPVPGDISLK